MADLTVDFGHMLLLSELCEGYGAQSSSVRVTGTLAERNAPEDTCVIEHEGARVVVETAFLEGFAPGGAASPQLQFIGEIVAPAAAAAPHPPRVRARVWRDVSGMDMNLYKEAIMVQRKFLMDQDAAGDGAA
uniref:Uncharacterized protein n=1 Tax=Phaeomonas parva TaxID=124430 RepID=A0A7S1U855_9STRA|mmetsp:Transcript_36290/g.113815  ORF Transcript_36290/g.113815 Transcript_36290/m.113815 type:complete len:132 (+) Transcript_36290:288-683(+)|eukprot:CAMPEP_0118864308 /NCGR_PEP_ID=MMETSP1163-20130328/8930_1 /TAXON_ID=124430 /ORGANISM="Phaeomonas parva, Strain CCMP2877" /LENGTH=131 /DNA_ID=CAMNT_0006798409 /DNA_START=255 /DNA_END=650 /DNA_ORIENTATION=+